VARLEKMEKVVMTILSRVEEMLEEVQRRHEKDHYGPYPRPKRSGYFWPMDIGSADRVGGAGRPLQYDVDTICGTLDSGGDKRGRDDVVTFSVDCGDQQLNVEVTPPREVKRRN